MSNLKNLLISCRNLTKEFDYYKFRIFVFTISLNLKSIAMATKKKTEEEKALAAKLKSEKMKAEYAGKVIVGNYEPKTKTVLVRTRHQ